MSLSLQFFAFLSFRYGIKFILDLNGNKSSDFFELSMAVALFDTVILYTIRLA